MMKPPETNESLTKEKMMDQAVREGLLRLMPPDKKLDYFVFTFSLLAWVCVYLVNQVKSLGATYGLLQLLRVLAVAHVLRFVQSEIYKVPNEYYLQNVLKYYDLPITATVSAFYTIFLIFPSPPNIILFPALFLMFGMILAAPTRIGLEQGISPSQGSSSNNELVHQKNPIDIQLIDYFGTILLAMMCVDLAVELEKLKGTYYVFSMVFVLASRHMSYIWQLGELPENNAPLTFHLRKVLQYYELPSTAAINGIYIIFITFSKTLFIVFCMELILLALLMYKREEPEQGTNPTQASSLNTNSLSVHHQSQDVANIGDDGIPSVHDANSTTGTYNFSGWEKGERIGAGGFGTVFKAHNREIGEGAVKVLNIGPNNECIRQEAAIISELKHHPNIVKYYGHDIDEQGHICLYMEYIKQGSLHDYVLKHGKLDDEPFIRDFTTQILSGLFHLHRNKIVHRDIKPENLLVDYDNTVKLVDFGLAKVLGESKGKHSVWGTPYYAAPELLHNKIYESSSEAYKADIWSLGCVVIYMFTQDHPTTGYDQPHPHIPERLSKEGKDFLKLCFKRNPADRPSAEKLLEDPFITAENGALIKKEKHY